MFKYRVRCNCSCLESFRVSLCCIIVSHKVSLLCAAVGAYNLAGQLSDSRCSCIGFTCFILLYIEQINDDTEKSAQRRRKHCALAVVRRTHKQTNKQTNTKTGAITIHCAAASLARSVMMMVIKYIMSSKPQQKTTIVLSVLFTWPIP